jgi:hypothetical protein
MGYAEVQRYLRKEMDLHQSLIDKIWMESTRCRSYENRERAFMTRMVSSGSWSRDEGYYIRIKEVSAVTPIVLATLGPYKHDEMDDIYNELVELFRFSPQLLIGYEDDWGIGTMNGDDGPGWLSDGNGDGEEEENVWVSKPKKKLPKPVPVLHTSAPKLKKLKLKDDEWF